MSAAPPWLIYCRVSTDEQAEEGASLDMQEQACRRYAELRQLRVADCIRDDGYSGTTAKRPGYQRALRDLTSGAAAGVIAWKLKRLHRNTRNWLDLAALSVDRGFGIAVVVDGIDTTTPHGRAIATVLATFAQLESEEIGVQTSAAMRYLKSQGYYTGGTVPAGCRVEPVEGGKRRRLVATEVGEALRPAWGWILAGESLRDVAKRLNDAGVPGARRGDGGAAAGWTPVAVRNLLLSPLVAGVLAPADVQAQVRARLAERATPLRGGRPPAPGARAAAPSPVVGLARCPTCGASLCQVTATGHGGSYRYFRCTNRVKGRCAQKDVRVEPVERDVFDAVERAMRPGGDYEKAVRLGVDEARAVLAERQAERTRLTSQRDQLSGRVASLTMQTQIGGAAWAEAMRVIGAELERVDRRLAELAGEIGAADVDQASLDMILAELAKGAAGVRGMAPADQAQALRVLLRTVTVRENGVEMEFYEPLKRSSPAGEAGEVRTQNGNWLPGAHRPRTLRVFVPRLGGRAPGSVGAPPR